VTTLGAARAPSGTASDAGAAALDAGVEAGIYLDAGVEAGIYLDAEDGVLSEFAVEEVGGASGGRALVAPEVLSDDAPGSARARYAFELAAADDYVIWGRVYAPDVAANRFWLQVDDGPWIKWRISVGEIWFWDDVHDDTRYGRAHVFALEAGTHVLSLANAGPGSRLDRIYITAGGDEPPGNDTPCDPPHTIEVGGQCLPSCGLLTGTACGPIDCEGRPPLPAYDCNVCCRIE
jgi:hypothetical protein